MDFLFGGTNSVEFRNAVLAAFDELNAIPATDLFQLGKKHSEGVIAGLISASVKGPKKSFGQLTVAYQSAVKKVSASPISVTLPVECSAQNVGLMSPYTQYWAGVAA